MRVQQQHVYNSRDRIYLRRMGQAWYIFLSDEGNRADFKTLCILGILITVWIIFISEYFGLKFVTATSKLGTVVICVTVYIKFRWKLYSCRIFTIYLPADFQYLAPSLYLLMGVDLIQLTQDRDKWWEFLNTVMRISVPQKRGISSLADWLLDSQEGSGYMESGS
jgi:hypothetical protein